MARRGWTNKPCPICGSTGGRGIEEVCNECKGVYAAGKRLLAAEAANVDEILVSRQRASHWNTCARIHTQSYDSWINDVFETAWHALVLSLTQKPGVHLGGECPSFVIEKRGLWGTTGEHFTHADDFYLVPRVVHTAINEFDRINRIAIETCYTRGKLEGMNLLMQLNSGTESPSDFSDLEAKLEKRLAELKAMVQPKKSE